MQSGFGSIIPFLQPLKEILILAAVGIGLWEYRGKFNIQLIDLGIIAYFLFTFAYVLLPIGELGIGAKLVAFKSTTFFAFVYLAGRLIKIREIYISKYFHYILVVTIAATLLLAFEILTDQHFQISTGYADFNFYLFNQEPTGNYGLTWTFETATGFKRFASFFANPLEFGAATLLTLSVIAGLYTMDNNRFKLDILGVVAILATQFSVLFAISRASLGSYMVMIFIYAWVTHNKLILRSIYAIVAAGVLYFTFFLLVVNPDLYDLIYETVTFTNPSSVGHIIAWLNGVQAMIGSPMGLGLGASGILAESTGGGTGGENQFLIIGVQTGVIAVTIYISIYIALIVTCWKWLSKLTGKSRKVCMALLLMKIGFIIPMFTSELESSAYISYSVWFLSGVFVNIISQRRMNLSGITPSTERDWV